PESPEIESARAYNSYDETILHAAPPHHHGLCFRGSLLIQCEAFRSVAPARSFCRGGQRSDYGGSPAHAAGSVEVRIHPRKHEKRAAKTSRRARTAAGPSRLTA